MANIYFAGTDLGDFAEITGSPTSNSTAAQISPNCSRGITLPSGTGAKRSFTSAASSFWLQCYFYGFNTAGEIVAFSAAGTKTFRLYRSSNGGNVLVQGWNGSTWSTLLDTGFAPSTNVRHKWDLHIVISDTGTVEFFNNGVQQGSTFSGDTLLTAATTVDKIELSSPTNSFIFSGLFVCDSDTRAITMQQSTLSGAGAETAWTGAYTDIDELGAPNDADFIYSATANDVGTFTKSAFPGTFASGYNCLGIWVNARALRAASGPQNLQLVCRSGTTNGVSGSKALDVPMAPYGAFFATDPATSSVWVVADADSAEVGVKAIT